MNVVNIERVLLCLYALTIFTTKPGIYISSGLFFIFFIYRLITDTSYRTEVIHNRLFLSVFFVFFIGILSKAISPGSWKDMGIFFYKGFFLITFPGLVMALKSAENKRYAFWIALSGFFVSVLLSFWQAFFLDPLGWSGQRVGGLWDVGRWAELTCYMFAFLLPLYSVSRSKKQRCALLIALVATVLSLLISGGRAGWLAATLVLVVYMLIAQRRTLLWLIPILPMTFFSINHVFPEQVKIIADRAVSITDTSSDDLSNYSRLLMWDNGIKLIKYNLVQDPLRLLFGLGNSQFEQEYTHFLSKEHPLDELVKVSGGNYSFRDLHNAILDSVNKLGLIYTLGFYIFLMLLLLPGKKLNINTLLLVISFTVMGVFYTNYLEFQTVMYFFLLACTHSNVISIFNENPVESIV